MLTDAAQYVGNLPDKIGDLAVDGKRKIGMTSSLCPEDFAHIYRRKTRLELLRISAAVMGIEFCYSAETAFVSPTILKIGVPHSYMSLVWCISPVIGFFLTPVLGSLSDGCTSRLGRRRPFILGFSVFIVLGLILVSNGRDFGMALGDTYDSHPAIRPDPLRDVTLPTTGYRPPPAASLDDGFRPPLPPTTPYHPTTFGINRTGRMSVPVADKLLNAVEQFVDGHSAARRKRLTVERNYYSESNSSLGENAGDNTEAQLPTTNGVGAADVEGGGGFRSHPWGIVLTVIGTVILDFDADACQSPARSYMLDVSLPEDHAVGLSTFTVMAGLGGSIGYVMGGIDWDSTALGRKLGGHVRVVFTIINFIYVICVIVTVFSFREVPLHLLREKNGRELNSANFEASSDSKKNKRSSLEAFPDVQETAAGSKKTSVDRMGVVSKLTASWRHYTKFRNESVEETSLVDDNDDEHDDDLGYSIGGDDVTDESATASVVVVVDESGVAPAAGTDGENDKSVTSGAREDGRAAKETASGAPCHAGTARRFKDYGAITAETSFVDGAVVEHRARHCRSDADTSPNCTEIECQSGKWTPGAPAVSPASVGDDSSITLKHYLYTIVHLPPSMRILCLTNLFSWSSLVAYTLYFTDFVGEAVFGGDPASEDGSAARISYEDGVRFGCWGMALYSMSCAIYSSVIDRLIKRFGAKATYICGQLSYSLGMILMSLTRQRAAIILLSFAPGIMYSTLFTMPYLLVAHYHANKFESSNGGQTQIRGLGTDVAVVSSMLFLAQFVLSSCMGSIIHLAGSTGIVLVIAAVLSACAAICSSQISYHGL